VTAHAASVTTRLNFMIAHRPGFTAPTVAARQLATLDDLTGGRIAVHIITGGSDEELAKDGDHLAAAALGSRLDKRLWTGVAALTGAAGNSTGLVGTPEQVADALLDYYDSASRRS
jgi:alkanesulfonate monooxygenase SsuD/methylene tetrahydromethanopterin reductase-like flavin-dependent oxidoreductase (luciferase family)